MGSVQLCILNSSLRFEKHSLRIIMKYFALLLVVGLAAASGLTGSGLKFEAGKEYVFEYSGRLMTGIPALANQYSGLGINATVSLVSKTPTTFGLVVSTPKFVKINDVLTPVEDNVPSTYEGTNWRRVKLPEMVEVPAEFKKILAIPVVAPVVVAADCSTYHRFAVKAQHVVQQGVWNTEIILKKNLIKVVPTSVIPKVLVNGQPMEIPIGKAVVAKDIVDHTVVAEIVMTPDHVVIVKAPRFLLEEVKTNGKIIEVVPSIQLKNKLCGVCGNFQKPIMSETVTGHCVYSRPELEIASWMIPSGSSMMSPIILSELKKETEMCSKTTVLPTKVAKAYKAATGKCTLLRHLLQKRPGQVCLSKVPVTQCGPSCKPQKSELTQKTVPFTCLPEGPVAERLISKVIIGEELPELATKVTSFSAQVRMPAHCVHALVTRGI